MKQVRFACAALILFLALTLSASAQIVTEQALLAVRTIMQFDFDTTCAGRAYEVLLNNRALSAPQGVSYKLGTISRDALILDPQGKKITYQNTAEDLKILITRNGETYRVWVQFPERTQPWYTDIPAADIVLKLGLDRVKQAALKQMKDPKYQAWRAVPEGGQMPAIPFPSRILAQDSYNKLFNDNVLDIRIAYGYLDDEPSNEPSDKATAEELRRTLIKKGFSRTTKDPWTLEKTFPWNGRTLTCLVSITYSAVPVKEGEQAQLKQSLAARDFFMGALKHADVIMYDGHSRLGRGPDFTPLKEMKSPGNIKVGNLVPFYLEFGDSFMIRFPVPFSGGSDLKDEVFAKTRYQIMVMDSCRSEAYYRRKILRDSIKYSGKTDEMMDLITTNNDSECADSIHTKLAVINGLMAAKTAPELDIDLNTGVHTNYNTTGLFIDSDLDTQLDEHIRKNGGRPKKKWYDRLGDNVRKLINH